jgi:hypothetical protein
MFKFLSRLYLTLLSIILAMVSLSQAQILVKNSLQSEILRITSTGQVGIMTTNPASRVAVNGGVSVGAGYEQLTAPANSLIIESALGIGVSNVGAYSLYVASGPTRINQLNINGSYSFPTAVGTTNQYLNGTGDWGTPSIDGDGVNGNEINAATNTTLTRSAAQPYTLALNLANVNSWSAVQTFSAGADFPSSGTWNTSGNLGAGVANPGSRLAVNGGAAVGADYATIAAPLNGLLVKGVVGINTSRPYRAQLYSYCNPSTAASPNITVSILGEAFNTNNNYYGLAVSGAANTPTSTSSSGFLARPGVNGAVAGGVFAGSVHFVTQGDLGFLQANSPWLGWKPDAAGTIRDVIMAVYGGVKYQDDGGAWGSVALNARRAAVLAVNYNTGADDYGIMGYASRHYLEGQLYVRGETWNNSGNASWTNYSDIRLKDVSGVFGRGLLEILALQPVRYHYKQDNPLGLPSDQEYYGFIAQDVDKVIPEAVKRSETGYLAMFDDPIVLSMVNAVKELKARNDALQAGINKLQKP